jgi:hypothetical protein
MTPGQRGRITTKRTGLWKGGPWKPLTQVCTPPSARRRIVASPSPGCVNESSCTRTRTHYSDVRMMMMHAQSISSSSWRQPRVVARWSSPELVHGCVGMTGDSLTVELWGRHVHCRMRCCGLPVVVGHSDTIVWDRVRRPTHSGTCGGVAQRIGKKAGRNNSGRITVWHRGGGHKRLYRIIDFQRRMTGKQGHVRRIEYDPNRSARIALIDYVEGYKLTHYIIAPEGLKVRAKLQGVQRRSSQRVGVGRRSGSCCRLKARPSRLARSKSRR